MTNAREKALRVLIAVDEQGAYSNLQLHQALQGTQEQDAAFIKQLVYGTVAYRLSLDYLLASWLTRPLQDLSSSIRNLLRLGLYQIVYLQVPDYAAVGESVKLAHRFGHKGTAKLVNAILRRATREAANLPWPETGNLVHDFSIRFSFPEWMISRWLHRLGREATAALCHSINQPSGTDLRANTLRTTSEQLLDELMGEGFEPVPNKYVRNSLHLVSASLPKIEALHAGRCVVQGAASTLVGHVLDPQAGELVYDVCAAPGGKALHLAEMMGDCGRVIAMDIHAHRLPLIERTATRLGITVVETEQADATTLSAADWRPGQRVLVDAPCSGLGVIRRKPDIRLHRNAPDLQELARLQRKILQQAAGLVAPGGSLVYSVCSTEPEESLDVIDGFLRENRDFLPADWPDEVAKPFNNQIVDGHLATYPHLQELDGFFICRLQRR